MEFPLKFSYIFEEKDRNQFLNQTKVLHLVSAKMQHTLLYLQKEDKTETDTSKTN